MAQASFRRWPVLLISALALVVASCTGGEEREESRRLVALVDDVASSLDIDGAQGASFATIREAVNLYDTLVDYKITREQDGVLIPDYSSFEGRLAESWTQDGLKWTFKLREGVKSCARNTLSADDVVYTFARAKSVSGATPLAWFLSNAAAILPVDPVLPDATAEDKVLKDTEVRKIDDFTVEFTQSQPNALWPDTATVFALIIFDSKEMKEHATPDDPWSHKFTDTGGAANFGPYCVQQWTKGQDIVLKANPDYYRDPPFFTEVIIRKIPESANRVAAIRRGDADIVTELSPREFANLNRDPNVDVLGWFNNEVVNLVMNYKFAPWNAERNELIRQAIAYALPYNDIINAVFPDDSARRLHGVLPAVAVGFKEIRKYETDIQKAKTLLAQAGFPDGKGLEKFSGAFDIFYVVERKAALEPLAVQIQTALGRIGISATLQPVTLAEAATRWHVKRDMPMALLELYPYVPDAGYHTQLFFLPPDFGGVNNTGNYVSEQVNSLWQRAHAMNKSAERDEILGQAQEIVAEDLPWIPIVEKRTQIAVRKGITGFLGRGDDLPQFYYFRR